MIRAIPLHAVRWIDPLQFRGINLIGGVALRVAESRPDLIARNIVDFEVPVCSAAVRSEKIMGCVVLR